MKHPLVLAVVCLALTGCKDKTANSPAPASPKPAELSASVENAAAPAVVQATPGVAKATPRARLPQNTPPPAEPAAPDQKASFSVNSPIKNIIEIAGGREVLMQLDGDPYWKRFSMEKMDWLPLPAVNLADADLAGNQSSLYVLDRRAGDVRKYNLSDLKQTAIANLVKLGDHFGAIFAGCNSDRARVHVLTGRGSISLDAVTLERRDFTPLKTDTRLIANSDRRYRITGDGMSLFGDAPNSYVAWVTYVGDYVGFSHGYFDVVEERPAPAVSVSAAFSGDFTCANPEGKWVNMSGSASRRERGKAPFTFPNCPVLANYVRGNTRSVPAPKNHLEFCGFFDTEPLAKIEVPEWDNIANMYGDNLRSFCPLSFDPYSRRIGIVDPNQKTWVVRDLQIKTDLTKPVLLNWPDTSVARGGEFEFKPLLLGEGKLSAELLGTKGPAEVKVEDGRLSFQVAKNELASLLLLNLTVTGPSGSVTYPIPVHLQGPPPVFASPELNPTVDSDPFAASFKTLTSSKENREGLASTFYESLAPVKEVYGPINGHLALQTEAKSIDFLSLETKKVVNSIPVPDKTKYYPGGGALFEYNANTRTLARISVPEGKRENTFPLPPDSHLHGLGIGVERNQPLTLFLERRKNSESERFGDFIITVWDADCTVLVANSETFRTQGWMQPQAWSAKPDSGGLREVVLGMGGGLDFPRRVVGSRDGALLVLPKHLLVVSPRYSLAAPYPADTHFRSVYNSPKQSGSITGLVSITREGDVFRNGVETKADIQGGTASPCGRYLFVSCGPGTHERDSYEIVTVENRRPLFIVNRFAALMVDGRSMSLTNVRQLQDNGPLLVTSPGGHLLQFVDCDIPHLARDLVPDSFHVISQPMPCVIEGGTYEYQIQVNNPDLVGTYRLHAPPENASISPSGLLRFTSPKNIPQPLQINFSIEISGKDGRSVLHEFPLLVVPRSVPNPVPPPKPGHVF